MRKINRETQSLQLLAEQFIDEQFEMRKIDLKEAVEAYLLLIGGIEPLAMPGFLKFLHAIGIKNPTTKDFDNTNVSLTWEFLAQHYGTLKAAQTMKALKRFWRWCVNNGYIEKTKMPADLGCLETGKPFKVKLVIPKGKWL